MSPLKKPSGTPFDSKAVPMPNGWMLSDWGLVDRQRPIQHAIDLHTRQVPSRISHRGVHSA